MDRHKMDITWSSKKFTKSHHFLCYVVDGVENGESEMKKVVVDEKSNCVVMTFALLMFSMMKFDFVHFLTS